MNSPNLKSREEMPDSRLFLSQILCHTHVNNLSDRLGFWKLGVRKSSAFDGSDLGIGFNKTLWPFFGFGGLILPLFWFTNMPQRPPC